MKGGPKEQVVKQQLDPGMTQYRDDVFNKARQVAGQGYTPYGGDRVAGADPSSQRAAQAMGGMPGQYDAFGQSFAGGGPNIGAYSQAGSAAARALGGDRSAQQSMMDPYQSQVIDALGGEYDRMRDKASMATNSEATGAGAFGGSRHALLEGERLGALDRGQMSDTANLLSGGYNSMMDRAGNTANLGLGAEQAGANYRLGAGGLQLGALQGAQSALGQQFGMGDYMHNINQQWLDTNYQDFRDKTGWGEHQLGILQGGMGGAPAGQTTTQPLYNNKFNAAAGGAATGFGIGGPIGAGIGGIGGLLFG